MRDPLLIRGAGNSLFLDLPLTTLKVPRDLHHLLLLLCQQDLGRACGCSRRGRRGEVVMVFCTWPWLMAVYRGGHGGHGLWGQ